MNRYQEDASKVQAYLAQMTVEEKIGQLCQPFGWHMYTQRDGKAEMTDSFRAGVEAGAIGSMYGTLRADPWTGVTLETGLSPEAGAQALNDIQRYAIEHSRLGIPILFGEECSHGHMAIGGTVFPVPLAIGSTWNIPLYKRMCEAVALETRAQGGAATYSPVLDVVRDPRWGRTEECFGEDPYLIGEFAVAAVQGLQGERLDAPNAVIATLKHYVAYGASEGGRNAAPVHMGTSELHDVDLYPFRKAVEAGAQSIMPAYHEIDGTPCTVNSYLLDNVLRKTWGFEGFVITDCGAIDMLVAGHDVAEDGAQAAAMALKAGIDMEMSGVIYAEHLKTALERGDIAEADLDTAVSRVLTAKFKLGLFDQPYVDPAVAAEVIGCEAHREIALQLAREGIVLLKNEDAILPLSNHESGTVAVIGPNADQSYNQLGDYTSPQPPGHVVTVLRGLQRKLGHDRVTYAPGCTITGDSKEGFESALACAEAADTVVLVMGGSSARDFGEGTIDLRTGASVVTGSPNNDMECGEGIDRSSLTLAGVQLELMQQIHALGKKLIVVWVNGRPIAEPWVEENAAVILEAWYPGQAGGDAIADILFGDVNPSGKLTISIPKEVGQLPVHYNRKRSSGKRYLEMDVQPRYPFGFGLSYTSYDYHNLALSSQLLTVDELLAGAQLQISVDVTNTGEVAGYETVQLYVTDCVSTITRPAKELKGFDKVWLAPGETKRVHFTIGHEQLGYTNNQAKWIVEPGLFKIAAARHSADKEALVAEFRIN